MNKELLQKNIDNTEYWDAKVLDFKIDYFGDIIKVLFEDQEDTVYEIILSQCYKVVYETDAERRNIEKVQEMNVRQLSYFVQDISIDDSDMEDFFKMKLDLFPLIVEAICKDVVINKKNLNDIDFFWRENDK